MNLNYLESYRPIPTEEKVSQKNGLKCFRLQKEVLSLMDDYHNNPFLASRLSVIKNLDIINNRGHQELITSIESFGNEDKRIGAILCNKPCEEAKKLSVIAPAQLTISMHTDWETLNEYERIEKTLRGKRRTRHTVSTKTIYILGEDGSLKKFSEVPQYLPPGNREILATNIYSNTIESQVDERDFDIALSVLGDMKQKLSY